LFPVHAFTIGTNYDLFQISKLRVAAGGQFTIYHTDEQLNNLYGRNPMAVEFYIRLYPSLMMAAK